MGRLRFPFLILLLTAACETDKGGGQEYYDRVIQPILNASCSTGTSPCHKANPDSVDPYQFVAGNLDLTSFENVHKRPDVLRAYGAYPVPFLLLKAAGPTDSIQISYNDMFFPSEIPHNGGGAFQVGSPAYLTLQGWLQNGATRDGVPPDPQPVEGQGACTSTVPPDFDPMDVMATFTMYRTQFEAVQAVIDDKGCNAGRCHGAPQSDFFLTCGSDESQLVFNFGQVWAFVDMPVDDSEVLKRPLAPSSGGVSHTGGVHWQSRDDVDYVTVKTFAELVGKRVFGAGDPAKTFFAEHVQPIFLQRGCASEGCHSPAAMNDFKLRAGTQGFFSAVALQRNYDLAKNEFLAFESPDVRRGRILTKNVLPEHTGIPHRGGALLETPGAGGAVPTSCPAVYDPTFSAYCTFAEWARIERAAAGNPNSGGSLPIVYVERSPTDLAGPLQFDTFQPGADILVTDAPMDGDGVLSAAPAGTSLLGGCGLNTGTVDVRGPDVKGDGDTVAFAARDSAATKLQIFTVSISTGTCTKLPGQSATAHNFDPAWTPDGGTFIVYASTAAGGNSKRLNLPQSDLWRIKSDGSGAPERMTFLSNSEVSPQFMREGRVTMTTEKVDPMDTAAGFYQLSGRRINWDLTDYHPLLAQRKDSPVDPADPTGSRLPSINFQQATEIREGMNGNFYMVLSDSTARSGAGTIGIFNRSVGPFEFGRADAGFLASVTIPDPGGVYRSPYLLFDGRVLASYAANAADPAASNFAWDLVALDPITGGRTTILAGPGAEVEAVPAIAYSPRPLYYNRRQLVFGGKQDISDVGADHAVVHFPDAPMLATLLGSNLRRGRDVDGLRGADAIAFLDANGSEIGRAPLASDGSALVKIAAQQPVVIVLYNGGSELFRMTEEHQYGPGEHISMGVAENLFNNACGGCHGSVSGHELDIAVRPDVLTGASQSASSGTTPASVGP